MYLPTLLIDDRPPVAALSSGPADGSEAPAAEALCTGCPHPVDHPAVAALAVCACPETAERGGWLLVDPTGGPRWQLISSRGRYTMPFPPFVHKLSVGAGCSCAGGSCRLLRRNYDLRADGPSWVLLLLHVPRKLRALDACSNPYQPTRLQPASSGLSGCRRPHCTGLRTGDCRPGRYGLHGTRSGLP